MEPKIEKSLIDILNAIREIETFFDTRPKQYDIYLSDICLRRAIERNISIIGEAVNRILKEDRNVEITAARNIVDTRNYVIHSYDNVINEIMWAIVVKHLPILEQEVNNMLNHS